MRRLRRISILAFGAIGQCDNSHELHYVHFHDNEKHIFETCFDRHFCLDFQVVKMNVCEEGIYLCCEKGQR